jgi:hypothetical protein
LKRRASGSRSRITRGWCLQRGGVDAVEEQPEAREARGSNSDQTLGGLGLTAGGRADAERRRGVG